MIDSSKNGESNLRDESLTAMQRSGMASVILNLRNVNYLTSVALLPFIDIRAAAERRGGQVVLCNASDPVAQVLTISQLLVETRSHAHYLVMTEDVLSAIKWLNHVDREDAGGLASANSVAMRQEGSLSAPR